MQGYTEWNIIRRVYHVHCTLYLGWPWNNKFSCFIRLHYCLHHDSKNTCYVLLFALNKHFHGDEDIFIKWYSTCIYFNYMLLIYKLYNSYIWGFGACVGEVIVLWELFPFISYQYNYISGIVQENNRYLKWNGKKNDKLIQ